MKKDRIVSKYETNKSVRAKIDKLLFDNAVIQSNLGIDSTELEKKEALEKTKVIAKKVYNICKIFAKNNFLEIDFEDFNN